MRLLFLCSAIDAVDSDVFCGVTMDVWAFGFLGVRSRCAVARPLHCIHPGCWRYRRQQVVLAGLEPCTPIKGGDLPADSGAGSVPRGHVALDDVAGADVDLCAVLDINADAVGTRYRLTGDISDAMIATLNMVESSGYDMGKSPIHLSAGKIHANSSAARTGVIAWYVRYISLGGIITATA